MGAARASTITLRTGTSVADEGPDRAKVASRGLLRRRSKPPKPVAPPPASAPVPTPTPPHRPPTTPPPPESFAPVPGPQVPSPGPVPPATVVPLESVQPKSKSKTIRLVAIAGVIAIAATGGTIALAGNGDDDPTPSTATTTTAPTSLPRSAPLPPTSLIAPLDVGGNVDLYVFDTETGALGQRLTTGEGQERAPTISPDRESLIYTDGASGSETTLRVMAVNGDDDRELFGSPIDECVVAGRPAWHPVEDLLAVACIDDGGQYSLNVLTINGELLTSLPVPDLTIGEPTFSPDGTRVAYSADESAEARGGALYWSAADGTGEPVQLTDGVAGLDSNPMWSPDGIEIAFHRRLDDGTSTGNSDIFVMNSDGSQLRPLAPDPATDAHATWSPDGSQIAFTSRRERPDVTRNWEIWVMNRDGSNLRPITNVDGFGNFALAWGRR